MRFVVLLISLAVVACVPAASKDRSDDACTWSWTDLPVPREHEWTTVVASAGNGTHVGTSLGEEDAEETYQGLLWQEGRLTVLGLAFGRPTHLWAVNGSGVAVGNAADLPVRFRDGAWEELALPEGIGDVSADVVWVDEAGNAVGATTNGVELTYHRWPVDRPDAPEKIELPVTYGGVEGVGADGTLFVSGDDESTSSVRGFVGRPDGTWYELDKVPGQVAVFPRASGGGVVVGTVVTVGEVGSSVEWDLDGHVLRTHTGFTTVDVNSSGLVLSEQAGFGVSELWQAGKRQAVLPRPNGERINPIAVNDDGSVVGQWDIFDVKDKPKPVVARCS